MLKLIKIFINFCKRAIDWLKDKKLNKGYSYKNYKF